jgi:hypothetical protein
VKVVVAVAIIAALVAAAAWALSSSEPAGAAPYTVEVRDVAGEPTLIVVPEVAVTAPGRLVMPEVVTHANLMPEVVVRASARPELAGVPGAGSEAVN